MIPHCLKASKRSIPDRLKKPKIFLIRHLSLFGTYYSLQYFVTVDVSQGRYVVVSYFAQEEDHLI